jgi:hypothetical protein
VLTAPARVVAGQAAQLSGQPSRGSTFSRLRVIPLSCGTGLQTMLVRALEQQRTAA